MIKHLSGVSFDKNYEFYGKHFLQKYNQNYKKLSIHPNKVGAWLHDFQTIHFEIKTTPYKQG